MAIKSSEYFIFDGQRSDYLGISNVNVSSGLMEETFMANREIVEQSIRGRDKPYFQEVRNEPLQFNLTFFFDEPWNEDKRREIARWLNVNYYKELIFSNDPTRILFAMPVGDIQLVHNGMQGYVELTMRCDSPNSYSSVRENIYDYSSNPPEGTMLEFPNHGDVTLLPELYIYKVGEGSVSIFNNSDGGREFKFTSLVDQETVYIDNENEYIETDLGGIYRYKNFNNNYLQLLPKSINRLNIVGNCQLKFRYKFKTLQG